MTNSADSMGTSKTVDSMIATCDHNEMVATGNMTFVWKCAKCGYVYGMSNTEIIDDRTKIMVA